MKGTQNIVGPQIGAVRTRRNFSQEELAAKCGVLGLDISRGTLAKIESQVRCVNDGELRLLARALGVKIEELYPETKR